MNPLPRARADFAPHDRINQVTRAWEPLFSRVDDSGVSILAMSVGPSHCNNQAILHGGVLAALADTAMGMACGRHLPAAAIARTIGLQVDYLGAVPLGAWLEIRPCVLKFGRSIAFANAQVFSDDQLVAMASATFSVR